MEIRVVDCDMENAPVAGRSVYVIVASNDHEVYLFHPWSLTEFMMRGLKYRKSVGDQLWPVNNSGLKFDVHKLVFVIQRKITEFANANRSFPTHTAMKVIAELSGQDIGKVEAWVHNNLPEATRAQQRTYKVNRQYRLSKDADISKFKGRPKVVLESIKELKIGTVHSILANVSGKLKTKLDQERVVTYFVNRFHAQGILEIVE